MNGLAIFLIIFLFLILIGGGIVLGIYLFDKRKKDKQKGSGKKPPSDTPTQTQPPSGTPTAPGCNPITLSSSSLTLSGTNVNFTLVYDNRNFLNVTFPTYTITLRGTSVTYTSTVSTIDPTKNTCRSPISTCTISLLGSDFSPAITASEVNNSSLLNVQLSTNTGCTSNTILVTKPSSGSTPPTNTLPVCGNLSVIFASLFSTGLSIVFLDASNPTNEPPFDNYTIEISDNNFTSISYRATFTTSSVGYGCSTRNNLASCSYLIARQEFTPPIPSSVILTSLSLRLITNSCRSNIVPITPFNQ